MIKKTFCMLLAAVLLLSLSACERKGNDPPPDVTPIPDATADPNACICEICDKCDRCLTIINAGACYCVTCPDVCNCPIPLGFTIDTDLYEEWNSVESNGVLSIYRGETLEISVRAFAMTIEEIVNVIGIDEYKVEASDKMSFDSYLKKVGKSQKQFASDFVKSGLDEGMKVSSTDEVKVGGKAAVKTSMVIKPPEPEESDESNDDNESGERKEGASIVYVIFDKSCIFAIVYNGENNSKYIDEFEKMAETFEVVKT